MCALQFCSITSMHFKCNYNGNQSPGRSHEFATLPDPFLFVNPFVMLPNSHGLPNLRSILPQARQSALALAGQHAPHLLNGLRHAHISAVISGNM